MHKKLIARTAKLLSESKRSRRHQGIAIAYEHIPNDVDERNHGSIYALVNVNAPAASAEEVAELIIDAFFGEYYQDLTKDPLTSFESALARVNEELADITHNGNIHWLNNLNAVLAVHTGDTIHLTQTGKADAFLYRGGKSSHITRELAGDNINPLRTFINIASGDLLEGDKIAIVTPGVFFHISKDELQKYIEEFQPKIAISHLADLLENNSTEMQPNSILIIEAITPEAASEETVTEINDEVWLAEPNKTVETVIEHSAPFAQKAIYYTRRGWRAIVVFITATAIPWVKGVTVSSYDKVAGMVKDGQQKSASSRERVKEVIVPKETIEVSENVSNLGDITVNEHANSFVENTKSSGNVIHIKETKNKPKWLKLDQIDLSYAGKLKDKLSSKLQKNTGNKRTMLIAASVIAVLLIVSVFSVWRIRENAENQKLAEASYTEAQSKLEIGKSEAASGNRSQAAKTLESAITIAKGLEKNAKLKDRVISLESQLNTVKDSVLAITRVAATKIADISSITGKNTFGPYIIGTNAYVVSKENGSIAAISLAGESSNVLDKPKLDGKVSAVTAVTVRSMIVVFTDKGSVYEFDVKDVTFTKQAVSGDMETPTAMASFSTNIYTVDASGQIYKRTKTSTGYSARSTYIVDGSTAKDTVSLAIDSNVYATKSNGETVKYLGGKKQEYSLNDVPLTLAGINSSFTNENTTGIYLTSGDSIVRADAAGKFIGKYTSDALTAISGVSVDDTSKTVYVVANGSLLKFNQ
jgi:hypothetical protein